MKKIFTDIANSDKATITLKEAVNLLSITLLNIINQKPINVYGNLTPLFLGQNKALESGDDKSWVSGFTKASSISTDQKFNAIDIADQYIAEETLNRL